MMRLDVILIASVIAASAAVARPVATPKPPPPSHPLLDLSGVQLFREKGPSEFIPSASDAGAQWTHESALPRLAIGPLHAEIGHDDNPRANLSEYKLQGMDQLGNSVWANQEGRSAKLLFTWPTER